MKLSTILVLFMLTVSTVAPALAGPLGYTMSKYVEKSNCAQSKWAKKHFSRKPARLSKLGHFSTIGLDNAQNSLRQPAKISEASVGRAKTISFDQVTLGQPPDRENGAKNNIWKGSASFSKELSNDQSSSRQN